LPNLDKTSKSDPRVIVFYQDKRFEDKKTVINWIRIGSTETVDDNLNPEFTKSFIFDYYFEYLQNLRFVVLDMDDEAIDLEDNDYIGYIDLSISDLLSESKSKKCTFKLNSEVPEGMGFKKNMIVGFNATITLSLEILKDNNYYALMNISGKNLDKKDVFGKSDPYFIIYKKTPNDSWAKVYQSIVIKNTLNPDWTGIDISLLQLNSGDDKKLLKIEVWDWDRDSEPDYIGGFEATFEEIKEKKEFELINDKKKEKNENDKKSKKNYTNSGSLVFNRILIKEDQSFSSFTLGGTEIDVDFAIDFTNSNGEPDHVTSLHYINPKFDPMDFYSMNDYQKAISAIGYVLEPYDTNKMMGAYGYGGCFNKSTKPSFDYPLNDNPEHPKVLGTRGVLDTYTEALKKVALYGPTNFKPMIEKIRTESRANVSSASVNGHRTLLKYNILVFLTDGTITDMEETIHEIELASRYPMSIIIIGVGRANFDLMKKLDSDDKTVDYRDIVQFVPFNKFIDNPFKIASETLAEVPFQLLSYARKNDVYPPFAVRTVEKEEPKK
jgi:hypothetical protein